MPPFFSNKKLIILLASLIVLVALIGFSLKDKRQLSWPEQFVNDTVGWFELIFNRPAQYVAGFFENIDDIKNVYNENKILKSHLEQYAELSQKYDHLKQDNVELEKMLGLEDEPSLADYQKHYALVISRAFDEWNKLITVNKGSQAGIKPGMAVITADGFIGKISNVSQFTSDVVLISDLTQTNQISAIIQGNPETYGMIEGYDPKKHALLYKKIPIDAKIEVGQTVITSGLGNVFPSGLIIGKVTKAMPDQNGLTKTAFVDPAANLDVIRHVVIVERIAAKKPAQDPDGDKS